MCSHTDTHVIEKFTNICNTRQQGKLQPASFFKLFHAFMKFVYIGIESITFLGPKVLKTTLLEIKAKEIIEAVK